MLGTGRALVQALWLFEPQVLVWLVVVSPHVPERHVSEGLVVWWWRHQCPVRVPEDRVSGPQVGLFLLFIACSCRLLLVDLGSTVLPLSTLRQSRTVFSHFKAGCQHSCRAQAGVHSIACPALCCTPCCCCRVGMTPCVQLVPEWLSTHMLMGP